MAGKDADDAREEQAPRALPRLSLADHPTASAAVRRFRAAGGLLAFVAVAVLSWRAGAAPEVAASRGVACGVLAHLGCWAAAQAFWTARLSAAIDDSLHPPAPAEPEGDERRSPLAPR